jgi:hypothetical protein
VRLMGQLWKQRRLLFVLLEWRLLGIEWWQLGIEWWQLGIERRKLGRILLLRPGLLDAVRSDGAHIAPDDRSSCAGASRPGRRVLAA